MLYASRFYLVSTMSAVTPLTVGNTTNHTVNITLRKCTNKAKDMRGKQNKLSIKEAEFGYSAHIHRFAHVVLNRKYYWREQTNDPDSLMHTSQYISRALTPLAFCVCLNPCLSPYHHLWLLVRRIVMFSAVFISVVLGLGFTLLLHVLKSKLFNINEGQNLYFDGFIIFSAPQ